MVVLDAINVFVPVFDHVSIGIIDVVLSCPIPVHEASSASGVAHSQELVALGSSGAIVIGQVVNDVLSSVQIGTLPGQCSNVSV